MSIMIDDQRRRHHTGLGFHPFSMLVRAVAEMASAAVSALGEWQAARALHRLDDAALKDLGVSRGNIEGVVKKGSIRE